MCSPTTHIHADLSPAVQATIERGLGVRNLRTERLAGGMNSRTFLAEAAGRTWVVRVEPAESAQLRRAYTAQRLAAEAGVAVPRIAAADLEPDGPDGVIWSAEEWVEGIAFHPRELEPAAARKLCARLGEQLRLLHAVPLDLFGTVPPRPYPCFASFPESIDHAAGRIARSLEQAGIPASRVPEIEAVYALLRESYPGPPRLCHGDCAGSNLLVHGERVAALVDWEWAFGDDPAANVAYWSFWNDEPEPLDWLLEGYAASDPEPFRRRILAHEVATSIGMIDVYGQFGDPEGIAFCRRRLDRQIAERRWR